MTMTGPNRVAAAVLPLLLCGTGLACSKKGDAAERSLVELRPVLSSAKPPCDGKAPKGEKQLPKLVDGKVDECLTLGKPIIDATDVRSATVAETPAKEPALSIVLGQVGSANLDNFARANQGKRLAIVADGGLVSAPVLQFTSFAGRIQITGLPKPKTDQLFERLKKIIKPG